MKDKFDAVRQDAAKHKTRASGGCLAYTQSVCSLHDLECCADVWAARAIVASPQSLERRCSRREALYSS